MTLTSQRMTEIIDEEVERMLKHEEAFAESIYVDGGFPGDLELPGPQRLKAYWAMTPDLSDIPLLLDPDWEMRIRHGLDQPPVNPYWKNQLRIPGSLKKLSQDFVKLNQKYGQTE